MSERFSFSKIAQNINNDKIANVALGSGLVAAISAAFGPFSEVVAGYFAIGALSAAAVSLISYGNDVREVVFGNEKENKIANNKVDREVGVERLQEKVGALGKANQAVKDQGINVSTSLHPVEAEKISKSNSKDISR